MARIRTLEDDYEYRVNQIFRKLREEYDDDGTEDSFEDWIESRDGRMTAGRLLLSDVEAYMGIPEADVDEPGDPIEDMR